VQVALKQRSAQQWLSGNDTTRSRDQLLATDAEAAQAGAEQVAAHSKRKRPAKPWVSLGSEVSTCCTMQPAECTHVPHVYRCEQARVLQA
jgi:hypothetical protein